MWAVSSAVVGTTALFGVVFCDAERKVASTVGCAVANCLHGVQWGGQTVSASPDFEWSPQRSTAKSRTRKKNSRKRKSLYTVARGGGVHKQCANSAWSVAASVAAWRFELSTQAPTLGTFVFLPWPVVKQA